MPAGAGSPACPFHRFPSSASRSSSVRCRWHRCIPAGSGFLRDRHFRILRLRQNLLRFLHRRNRRESVQHLRGLGLGGHQRQRDVIMSKIELFGNLWRKFFGIPFHAYQQPSMEPVTRLQIAIIKTSSHNCADYVFQKVVEDCHDSND